MNFNLSFLLLLLASTLLIAQPGNEGAPQEPSTEEQLAGQFYNAGEWDKASAAYEELYDTKPVNFYYTQPLHCYVQLKDFKSAEKLVARHSRRNPGQPAYAVDLAWVYEQAGDADKSKKQYNRALREIDFQDQRAVADLANALEGRNQIDLAVKAYEDARKASITGFGYEIELARLYALQDKTELVLREYLSLLNLQGPQYMEQIQQSLQDIIAADADGKKAELIRTQLLREIQRSPDNFIYAELLIWYLVQKRDFEGALLQAKALDKRLRENGSRVYAFGGLAMSNDQFEAGRKAFQYIIDKGPSSDLYVYARKELAVSWFKKLTRTANYSPEELAELHKLLDDTYKELGVNENSAHVGIRKARLEAFYQNQPEPALALLEGLLNPQAGLTPRTAAEVKLEMADIQLMTGEEWEATLLYSQVEKAMKTDTLGQEAKFRNARLAYYKGEFEWAKAQLDVLKAATSKLIANDALELSLLIGDNLNFDTTGEALRMFARADLAYFQNRFSKALDILDSLQTGFPESTLGDDLLYRRARIFVRQTRFKEAADQLEKILLSYRSDILADNALFMLAELQEYEFKDTNKAMELYKELLTEFPGSLYVVEARKRFRNLRGDVVQ